MKEDIETGNVLWRKFKSFFRKEKIIITEKNQDPVEPPWIIIERNSKILNECFDKLEIARKLCKKAITASQKCIDLCDKQEKATQQLIDETEQLEKIQNSDVEYDKQVDSVILHESEDIHLKNFYETVGRMYMYKRSIRDTTNKGD